MWKGAGAGWIGQLWPNQTTLLWRSGINGGTTHFWREIDCVMMETLMSGTQGEKAHIVYKEEDGIHMLFAYELYFDMSV